MKDGSKRTFREHMQYILLWLLFIWISCLCAILVDLMLFKIVTTIVKLPFVTEAIVHIVGMALGASAPLAAIAYLISYHLGEFSVFDSMVEGIFALILQLPFGLLLGFPSWITGGVKWLAGLIEYGSDFYNADQISDVTLTNFLLAFLIFGVFYLIVKYVFGVLGRDTRIRHRIELTGSPVKPSERDQLNYDA